MKLATFSVILLLHIISCANGGNILFYWGCSGYSHRISVWPLIEKLAEKGHKISFISPYPHKNTTKHPNIEDIVPQGLAEDIGLMNLDFVSLRMQGGVSAIDGLWWFYYSSGLRGCESMMKNPTVLQWIDKSSFDLVVLDALFNDCGYGLVHKFKTPTIMYSPTTHFSWFKEAYGYPDENFSEIVNHYTSKQSFFQRMKNLLTPLYWEAFRYWDLFPRIEKILKEQLKLKDLPHLGEIEKNTSLILINQHFTEEYPRSLPPNTVNIGGIHCHDNRKPLPKDVADFIATANEGFIYLSFGTYATLSTLPKHLQEVFIHSTSKFPNIKFIIKYQGDAPQGLPKNVKTIPWINQQDIIAHPKIRAFIGHGGLLSTQEAIYHGVPMIVVPLFAEQDFNAVRAHERKTAIALEIKDLTGQKLVAALSQILNDKQYKENTMKLSRLFRDREVHPLDSAVWWVEYILRHKNDTSHLLPVGVTRTWYERRMLDVWGFLAIILLISIAIVGVILNSGLKMIFGNRAAKIKDD